MNMMSAVAIVPAIGLPSSALALGSADSGAWLAAVRRYKSVSQRLESVGETTNAAYESAEAACPRRDEFFSRYNMGCGWSRDRNFRSAYMSLCIERGKGRRDTPEEAKQITDDALRLVDEFEVWLTEHKAAFAEYDRQQELLDSVIDEQAAARNEVIGMPAPTSDALLFKIELLIDYLTECESEDADRLRAIQADARRLLIVGRA